MITVYSNLSVRKYYYSVEHVEDLQPWLMYGEYHSAIRGSQSIQMSEELSGRGRIQA